MEIPAQTELELVSPEKLIFSEAVDMVVVPGEEGDFGALPGHAPFVCALRAGVVEVYQKDSVIQRIFVSDGFAEVTPERCTLLVEQGIFLTELDSAVLEQEQAEIAKQLADPILSSENQARMQTRQAINAAKQAALQRFF